MSINNKVHFIGYLGEDAKQIVKDSKHYTILNVATVDSYPKTKNNQTVWHKMETVWHDVFVFNPTTSRLANELKKGDKIEIMGSIAYKFFKDESGYSRKQALIKAHFIDKVLYEKQDGAFTKKIIDELADSLAA